MKGFIALLFTMTMLQLSTYGAVYVHDTVEQRPEGAVQQQLLDIEIIVKDATTGTFISGATVKIGSKRTKTSPNGRSLINTPSTDTVFRVSYVGYNEKTVRIVPDQRLYEVKLETTNNQISEIVINSGIISRSKESFTGATATITGGQLRQVGNMNVVESLRSLDPSLVFVDNVSAGSNPNALATIEMRGQSSISTTDVSDQFTENPNQPLFILNGFQATLRQITDLDMNRVAAITILKDAASTAIYGAQAANGVIVIETIRPKAGTVRVNYSSDNRIEMYDLSSYNMMNAAEKLEFERLSGRFRQSGAFFINGGQTLLPELYNERLKLVASGVDTYWLDKPLQTGFTQKHSLYIEGGAEDFQYGAGVNYQNIKGLMQGSGRDNWGANLDFIYRVKNVNIMNQLLVNGYNSTESPFGSFTQYVQLNPYYAYGWEGTPDRYLGSYPNSPTSVVNISNPFYNASLNSYDQGNNFNIANNLSVNWDISKDLRFSTRLQVQKGMTGTAVFVSPDDTQFDNVTTLEKGSYRDGRTETFNYQVNGMFTYNKSIGKNVLTANLQGEIYHNYGTSYSTTAIGFPSNAAGYPSNAFSYQLNSSPTYSQSTIRRANMLFSGNYAYDNRYLFDATYRLDGSTTFGSETPYSPFWSLGAGINLHNESYLKDVSWLDMLRLRANIGVTGNQNFGTFQSVSIYQYLSNINDFGQGTMLSSFGNPNLAWQNTRQISTGIDFSALDNRLSATVNAYHKLTDPLIIGLSLPSSTGIASYPENLGSLTTKGLELTLRYAIIQDLKKDVNWSLGVQNNMYESIYGGFGAATSNLNNIQLAENLLTRYTDGYSPNDIWAVKSLGIDPASGQEIFLSKDGVPTNTYNSEDIVRVGNTRPLSEGVVSSNFRYKGFSFSFYLRYKVGGDIVNNALYTKVENISATGLENNQDLRALTERWQNPGDISEFKAISVNTTTPMSSRFVQKENLLTGESFNLMYEFRKKDHAWLQRSKLQSLRFSVYANDIFRLSNVRVERGIDYPYARNLSFTISASL